MTTFVALDVETANADLASICQIGVVEFRDGAEARAWQTLVDPDDYFDSMNMAVHGITARDVAGAPTFAQVLPALRELLAGKVVVTHTPFDRTAIVRAIDDCGSESPLACTWLDSARVVRRAWSQFSHSGYGLLNVASALGIAHPAPHVAVEDARVAALVLLQAMVEASLDLEALCVVAARPLTGKPTHSGNPDGPLYGEVLVFTGALTMRRADAAGLAAAAGCAVVRDVTRSTTLLVVGQQDLRRLEGHQKSSKHRKAEEYIRCRQPIRIVGEQDFLRLLAEHEAPCP